MSWFKGEATACCSATSATSFGGIEVFADARPDDGKLELGVVTADGVLEWSRMLARAVAGSVADSPFVQATKARHVKVKLRGR